MIDFSKIENLSKTTQYYLINSCLACVVLFSIMIMFFVHFKVDNLQDQVSHIDSKISALDDEIRVLEVEWVYLTRPERLRTLAAHYLQNNGYALASQIKNVDKLEHYYSASYQKVESQDLILNQQKQQRASF